MGALSALMQRCGSHSVLNNIHSKIPLDKWFSLVKGYSRHFIFICC